MTHRAPNGDKYDYVLSTKEQLSDFVDGILWMCESRCLDDSDDRIAVRRAFIKALKRVPICTDGVSWK